MALLSPLRCLSLLVLTTALGFSANAVAQEFIVRNDSMDSSFSGSIATLNLDPDEMYSATFQIPDHLRPAELLGVQVIMVNGPEAGQTYCGRFAVEVWEESPASPVDSPHCTTGGVVQLRHKEPGDVIYSMSSQFQNDPIGFQLRGDPNNLQELRFSTINNDPGLNVTINPVILDTPSVRVGIKALDNFCIPTSGTAFPLLVTDQTETSDNFAFGYLPLICTPPNLHYLWRDFQGLLSSPTGDFVIRLILRDPTSTGGGEDVGVGDDVGPDVGVDVGSDAGPDVGVDVGSDAGHDDLDVGYDSGDGSDDEKDAFTGGEPDVGVGVDTSQPAPDAGGGGAVTLAITSISPSSALNTSSTNVVILGSGFLPGVQVLLGAENIGVTETLSERIRVNVPNGLTPGVYDVIVTNPNGQSALLAQGFTVTEPGDDENPANPPGQGVDGVEDGCGCRVVAAPSHTPASLLALLLGGLVFLRIRRRR